MNLGAALLAAVGLAALASVASGGSKPKPGPKLVTNPTNGNPISSWSLPALSQSALQALVRSVGFPESAVAKAVSIAMRESGGHPDAVVDTRGMSAADLLSYWGHKAAQEWSAGLWQVNVLTNPGFTVEGLKDPTTAAHAAYSLSSGGTNWAPWGG